MWLWSVCRKTVIVACQGSSCQPTFLPCFISFAEDVPLLEPPYTSISVFQLGQINLELEFGCSLEKVKVFRVQRPWYPSLKKLYIKKLNST